MKLWSSSGLATIVLAALVGGLWAQTGSKSVPSDPWNTHG